MICVVSYSGIQLEKSFGQEKHLLQFYIIRGRISWWYFNLFNVSNFSKVFHFLRIKRGSVVTFLPYRISKCIIYIFIYRNDWLCSGWFNKFSCRVTGCEVWNDHNMILTEWWSNGINGSLFSTSLRYFVGFDWVPINLRCKRLEVRTIIHIFNNFLFYIFDQEATSQSSN